MKSFMKKASVTLAGLMRQKIGGAAHHRPFVARLWPGIMPLLAIPLTCCALREPAPDIMQAQAQYASQVSTRQTIMEEPAKRRTEARPPEITTRNTAVIIVDMQEEFLLNKLPEKREDLVRSQIEVLRFCKAHDIPVIVVEFKDRSITIPEIRTALEGMKNRKYIVKKYNDGFEETGLKEVLEGLGARNIVLMGVNACACVNETAKSALLNGFRVLTSGSLIASDAVMENNCPEWYKICSIYLDTVSELKNIIENKARAVRVPDEIIPSCVGAIVKEPRADDFEAGVTGGGRGVTLEM